MRKKKSFIMILCYCSNVKKQCYVVVSYVNKEVGTMKKNTIVPVTANQNFSFAGQI